ncbi:unnamed protein product [Colias eurytheme]|nr:unnamed protein product [Colias eurytheme]
MSVDAEAEPIIIYRDNEIDIDELVFGEIPKFDDLFLPVENDMNANKTENINFDNYQEDDSFNDLPILLRNLDPITSDKAFEITEFNELNEGVTNLTRRYYGKWIGYTDPDDRPEKLEYVKRYKLENTTLQFLIHARYHVKKCIEQKRTFRHDRRYQMGYLFNRLRRIRYEQLKLISLMEGQKKSNEWRELHTFMRFYEKIVRYDVDFKDTCRLMETIDEEDARIKEAALSTSARPTKPGYA